MEGMRCGAGSPRVNEFAERVASVILDNGLWGLGAQVVDNDDVAGLTVFEKRVYLGVHLHSSE